MARRDDRIKVGVQDPTRPPFTVSRITARIAERVRFDSYWMIDHFMGVMPPGVWSKELTPAARIVKNPEEFFDPFIALGALAQRTKRIRLGTAVTDSARLHPTTLARSALTLQHVSKGRFILGIGAGERENTTPFGIDLAKSASRLEESLRVIRLLWSTRTPIDFEGEFFQLKGASLALRPYLKRPPPIWVAAMGPRMLEITARYADGWIPHTLSLERYEQALTRLRAAATSAGRDPAAITPGLVVTGLFDSTHEACHAALESPAMRMGALVIDAAAWREAGGVHPFGESYGGIRDFTPTSHSKEDAFAAMEKVPWEIVHALFPHGTAEEMASFVQDYERVGLKHVVFSNIMAISKPQKALSSFATLVKTARLLRRGETPA
jgi:phthiodiolone/phenolphthiodiolone dimycocerosates ketoreductase